MTTKDMLIEFYTRCVSCDSKECPLSWKDYDRCIFPRGFHFESPKIKILVVGKNPGHLFKNEKRFYNGKTGKKLVEAHMEFHKLYYRCLLNDMEGPECSQFRERSNTFHKNLFRYLHHFLCVPKNKIYTQAAHTNLVKCSTRNERVKLDSKTMNTCFKKFFLKELELFKPRVILALGREVENFLRKHSKEINIPVIYIRHPSYYYRREDEKKELDEIEEKIKQYI